jgi:hypothetical protein
VLIVFKLSQNSKIVNKNWLKYYIYAILTPWKTDFIEMLTISQKIEDVRPKDLILEN